MKAFQRMGLSLMAAGFGLAGSALAATVTMFATPDGDANYAWNSKYGPYGYTTGETSLGVGLYPGGSYGNDYSMGIVEIPLPEMDVLDLEHVTLKVYSNGFGTGYYYGSAGMRWINPGTVVPTGNPVTDGMGPLLGSPAAEYLLWDGSQPAGWYEFDVTAHVHDDLVAGRSFSTFVVNGSRETSGSIRSAEFGGGFAPQLEVTLVPEMSSLIWCSLGSVLLLRRRRS